MCDKFGQVAGGIFQDRFREQPDKVIEPAGVIEVPVREDDIVEIEKVNLHFLRMFQYCVRVARIEQHLALFCLNICGKPVLFAVLCG